MIAIEVAKKYANALFMSAKERGLIERGFEQFSALRQLLVKDRSLLTFFGSPRVSEEQKSQTVRAVFGEQIEQLFVEFIAVLVEKHRATYLLEVIDEFIRQVEFEKGIARVTVTTAIPLTAREEQDLIEKLTAKTNKKIELEKKVDPAIVAGMIVVMADEIVDGSVRHGLYQLEEQLRKIKVA